ncbi:MAG: mechanosensitive ion channel [Myxococcales bacterium]|nr:mechanosensitive ion channel [Myxococcales bacterium]
MQTPYKVRPPDTHLMRWLPALLAILIALGTSPALLLAQEQPPQILQLDPSSLRPVQPSHPGADQSPASSGEPAEDPTKPEALPSNQRASDQPSLPEVVQVLPEFSFDVDTHIAKTPFFEHREFGFGRETFSALALDIAILGETLLTWLADIASRPFNETWGQAWRYSLFLLLFVAGVVADVHARRTFRDTARKVTIVRMSPHLRALRGSLLRLTGAVSVPLLAWLVSFFVQGLFDYVPWSMALSQALLMFIMYRLGRGVIDEALGGAHFPVPREAATRIMGVLRRSLRVTIVLLITQMLLQSLAYRHDVADLLRTLIRASMTLLSLQLFALQRPILLLLPTDGTARYQKFRIAFQRYLTWVLFGSVLLLGLWTAGFERAATTLLSRMYGIILLAVLLVLAQRSFDLYARGDRKPSNPVVATILESLDGLARLLIYGSFIAAVLRLLGLWGPLLAVLDSIGVTVGDRAITLLGVVRGGLFIAVAVIVSRMLRILLEKIAYPRVDMDVGAGYAINSAIHYFIVVVAIGGALIIIGVDLSALTVFSGALGIGIGFGMQDIARNTISGFILLFGGAIQKGDLIAIENTFGYVEKVGGRAVLVRTRDNEELLVPTNRLISNTITNYTHSDPHYRMHVPVTVAYGTDVHDVRNALLEAAHRFPGSWTQGDHRVWLTGFGGSGIEFLLLVWINGTDSTPDQARGELNFHIWQVFQEQNIAFPYPQRDIHIRTIPPELSRSLQTAGAKVIDLTEAKVGTETAAAPPGPATRKAETEPPA